MPEQLLVVDDEESVRETLAAVLREQGYAVVTAASGADALVRIHSTEFDLVLTDMRMGDVDGLRLLARVRQRWPNTVTIMLTGFASLESAIAAMRQGAYDYLCKPCPADELLATVARGLERRRLTRQVQCHVRDLEIAIDTARDLHSSLLARAEGTRALFQESQSLLTTTCSDVMTSATVISMLTQRLVGHVDAAAACEVDQIRAEAERLMQVVTSALGAGRTESVTADMQQQQPSRFEAMSS